MSGAESLWAWCALDIDEIAESIDDVRGAFRPISTRCCGALAGMDGLGLVGELSESFGFRGGSDALRRAPFVSRVGRGYLQFTFVSIYQ